MPYSPRTSPSLFIRKCQRQKFQGHISISSHNASFCRREQSTWAQLSQYDSINEWCSSQAFYRTKIVPLASAFACRCYFTKFGIGKTALEQAINTTKRGEKHSISVWKHPTIRMSGSCGANILLLLLLQSQRHNSNGFVDGTPTSTLTPTPPIRTKIRPFSTNGTTVATTSPTHYDPTTHTTMIWNKTLE